jgi:S-adenosylmethionine hydrolase
MLKATGFITLTTDFGLTDGFVGTMKGVIHTINPGAVIIDISHETGSQDVLAAAFLFAASYRYFPRGTVHVIVVDPGVGSQRRAVAVEMEEHYFVAPDSGVLTLALKQGETIKSIELTNPEYFLDEVSDTFHGRDIFAPVAAHLSLGVEIEKLGNDAGELKEIHFPEPEVSQNGIKGHIIHIDKFGNLITDIKQELFNSVISDGQFSIKIAGIELDKISRSYADVAEGKPLAIFDSFGNLEIAVNCGSAAEKLKARKGDSIEILLRNQGFVIK